jgi:hypothetical protein
MPCNASASHVTPQCVGRNRAGSNRVPIRYPADFQRLLNGCSTAAARALGGREGIVRRNYTLAACSVPAPGSHGARMVLGRCRHLLAKRQLPGRLPRESGIQRPVSTPVSTAPPGLFPVCQALPVGLQGPWEGLRRGLHGLISSLSSALRLSVTRRGRRPTSGASGAAPNLHQQGPPHHLRHDYADEKCAARNALGG